MIKKRRTLTGNFKLSHYPTFLPVTFINSPKLTFAHSKKSWLIAA